MLICPNLKKYIMMRYFKILIILITCFFLNSCVSYSRYNQSEKDVNKLQTENLQISEENRELKAFINENQFKFNTLTKELEYYKIENKKLNDDYITQKREVDILKTKYNDITSDKSTVENNEETKKLLEKLQAYENEKQLKEDKLKKAKNQQDQLFNSIEEKNRRLSELEARLAEKDSITNALKRKVSDALLGFEGKGLTVHIKNGKVYVSLENSLMFLSGKYEMNSKGKRALESLAKVLEKNKDINVTIEGHTDDVPYKGKGEIKDNWDLSVLRATEIIRILEVRGVDGKMLTAAGRSHYEPINPTKTADARAKNRRTEIILTPKLTEIFKILNN